MKKKKYSRSGFNRITAGRGAGRQGEQGGITHYPLPITQSPSFKRRIIGFWAVFLGLLGAQSFLPLLPSAAVEVPLDDASNTDEGTRLIEALRESQGREKKEERREEKYLLSSSVAPAPLESGSIEAWEQKAGSKEEKGKDEELLEAEVQASHQPPATSPLASSELVAQTSPGVEQTPPPANEIAPIEAPPAAPVPEEGGGQGAGSREQGESVPPSPQSPVPSPQSPSLSANEVRIISPQPGTVATRTTNLVIQFPANAQPKVTVNGKPIDEKISTQLDKDAQGVATQVWYNVPLKKGENSITAQVGEGTASTVTVQAEHKKAQVDIRPTGDGRVQADGRSTLALEGTITDEDGAIIPEDFIVTLTTSAGKFVGADQDKDLPGFQVIARQGQFTARLQSTIQAQRVRVRAAVETDRKPAPRRSRGAPSREQGENVSPTLFPPLSNPFPFDNEDPIRTDTSLQRSNDSVLNDPAFPQQSDTPLSLGERAAEDDTLEAYTQVEFTTYLRPSLATGMVNLRIGQAGTDFWGSRVEFLNPDNIGDGTEVDFKAAFFATGKVGDWLFTGAYNSYRPLNQDCEGRNRLFGGTQFCEQPYPVYGDSSTSQATAPSIDSVFARLERSSPVPGAEPDYVMWGDYNTSELARSSQLFSATTRQLHGFKGNYSFGPLQLTALYSNDIEGFQRDTIVPNGTSGFYFLSQRLLIPGSENVFVEYEEINRPGTVVKREALSRGQDYEIDYDRGTLLFRRPIFATELNPFGNTLVRRIVATYQNESGDDSNLWGGRLQFNLTQGLEQNSFAGATFLREDRGDQEFELYGADFLLSLGDSGQVVGEFARSNHNIFNDDVSGSAYRLEAYNSFGRALEARAYWRSVEENFANNATFSYSPGQTRYGAGLLARLGDTTSFQVAYDREENFGITPAQRVQFFDVFDPQPQPTPGARVDNSLSTFRAGVLQRFGDAQGSLEFVNRSREDRVTDTFDGDASQLVSRLALPLGQSLRFLAQNELNLGDSDPLYPNRTTLALDWRAFQGVTFRVAHQFFNGGLLRGNAITTFDTIVEHKFSEDTGVTGRYSVLSGFNGMTGQGAVGLNHRMRIAPGLRLNLGYEHVFRNAFTNTAAGSRFEQPFAISQTAATLGLFSGDVYSVGLEYTDNPNFQASARFERRNGSEGNNTVISAAAAGKLSPALTALARYQQAGGANIFIPASTITQVGGVQELGDTRNLRVGLAYRDPSNDKFNALLRYEYRENPARIPESVLLESGTGYADHLFAAEAIYAPNWRWEFYGKYALRNSTSFFSEEDQPSNTVHLGQARITYRLGFRTDLAVEGRLIALPSGNFTETGIAVEGGYYLTPDLRVGLGYSFGSVDDRDFSGYRSEGGFYLNFGLKINELFGGFGRQRPVPKQQEESATTEARIQGDTQIRGQGGQISKGAGISDLGGEFSPLSDAPSPSASNGDSFAAALRADRFNRLLQILRRSFSSQSNGTNILSKLRGRSASVPLENSGWVRSETSATGVGDE
jgi:hypothetical protein